MLEKTWKLSIYLYKVFLYVFVKIYPNDIGKLCEKKYGVFLYKITFNGYYTKNVFSITDSKNISYSQKIFYGIHEMVFDTGFNRSYTKTIKKIY